MTRIVTVTPNPALDLTLEVERLGVGVPCRGHAEPLRSQIRTETLSPQLRIVSTSPNEGEPRDKRGDHEFAN